MSNGTAPPDPGQQPGFTFAPGQLFPLPPPGTLENIPFATLSFAFDLGTGNLIGVVIDVAELLFDLVQGLINLFSGKPREQDTITVGTRATHGQNPASYLMGAQILRNLRDKDIVLSDSYPAAQQILGEIRKQGKALLEAQGVSLDRATTVVDNLWNNTTSADQPLPQELRIAMQPGYTLRGPTALLDQWATQYNQYITQGLDPLAAQKHALTWILNNAKLSDLGLITIGPLEVPVPPPQPGPQPPPGQPPTIPPGWPQPPPNDPNQDEVGDCCAQSAYWMEIIALSILQIGTQFAGLPTGGGGASADCCQQVTAAIGAVSAQLAAIAGGIGAIVPGTPAAIDLSAIVAQLEALNKTLSSATPTTDPNVKRIADALNGFPPDDADAVAAARSLIDQAVENYGFPADLAQLLPS